MDEECTGDCLTYTSEDFIDEQGFPYCRWCGKDKQKLKKFKE